MQRIKNITQYFKYDEKKTNLVFYATGGDDSTLCEFDITPVGPAVVRVQGPDKAKGEAGETWLVGVYDQPETLRFALPFKAVRVIIEPSGEAWVRRPHMPAAHENPRENENFTRMEKQGIDMDEISVALHRQAVFTRIHNNRESAERDAYTRSLERHMHQMTETVDRLQAAEKARTDAAAEAAAAAAE